MYSRILVVTGDQPWEDAPVEYAIALAADTGAELSILTVLLLPLIAGMPDVMACTLVVESAMAQSAVVLAQAAAAAEQAGVSYTTRVRWGNPADVILRTAEEEDCDLIIGNQIARHLLRIFDRGAQERRAAEGQPRPIPEHGIAAEDIGQRVKRHTLLPQVESFFDRIGARNHGGHNERRAQGEDSPGRLQSYGSP